VVISRSCCLENDPGEIDRDPKSGFGSASLRDRRQTRKLSQRLLDPHRQPNADQRRRSYAETDIGDDASSNHVFQAASCLR
jgi:hypothetical protein